jgi:predicted DNA binding CopG/RHH family protein
MYYLKYRKALVKKSSDKERKIQANVSKTPLNENENSQNDAENPWLTKEEIEIKFSDPDLEEIKEEYIQPVNIY